MIFKDYYKILGLESNKASLDEIKVAYREKAKKFHPDINVGNSEAEIIFKDINEAYRILSNTQSKRKYDKSWNNNIGKKKNKENMTLNGTNTLEVEKRRKINKKNPLRRCF